MHRIIFVTLLTLSMTGCATVGWEIIGIASSEKVNAHITQAEEWAKDSARNQGRVIEVADRLNAENVIEARNDNDMNKLERGLETQAKIDMAQEVSAELTSRKWEKLPDPPFDWSSLIPMLIGLATGTTTVGAVAFKMKGTIKTLAQTAIENGKSTEVNDTSHLEKHRS